MKATLAGTALGALWVGWYALACWWRPLAHCRCCKGSGRHYRKGGKYFRDCWWCRKTPGRRWRLGRRIWNFFRRHAHT